MSSVQLFHYYSFESISGHQANVKPTYTLFWLSWWVGQNNNKIISYNSVLHFLTILRSILSEVNTVKVAIYWPMSHLCVKINQFKINLKNVCGFTVNYDTAITEFEYLRTEFQKWHCCLKKTFPVLKQIHPKYEDAKFWHKKGSIKIVTACENMFF